MALREVSLRAKEVESSLREANVRLEGVDAELSRECGATEGWFLSSSSYPLRLYHLSFVAVLAVSSFQNSRRCCPKPRRPRGLQVRRNQQPRPGCESFRLLVMVLSL